MENYYQSLGEASQQHQSLNEASASASSTLNEKLDREREALMLFGEPLVSHSIVENVVNLSKAGAIVFKCMGSLPHHLQHVDPLQMRGAVL